MKRMALASVAAWVASAGCGTGVGQDAPVITALSPDSHAAFPIKASTNHAAAACNDCHGAFDTFKQFDCLGCHQPQKISPLHATTQGYAPVSASCYACHPSGSIDGAARDTHARFPIASGTAHQSASCASCHLEPQDRKQVNCTSCHTAADMAPLHVAVSDLKFTTPLGTSALCLQCHGDSQVPVAIATTPANHLPPVPQHAPFGIASGARHYQVACLGCHTAQRADKTFARDFGQKSCSGCHNDTAQSVPSAVTPIHGGMPGFTNAGDTGNCLTCHTTGQGAAEFAAHDAWFPISTAAGDKHAGLACASCHTVAADRQQIDCVTCHTSGSGAVKPLNTVHAGKVASSIATAPGPSVHGAACTVCHADKQQFTKNPGHLFETVAAHTPFNITSGSRHYLRCEQCHATVSGVPTTHLTGTTAFRSDLPWAYDFNLKSCLNCHVPRDSNVDANHVGKSKGGCGSFKAGQADPVFTQQCMCCHPSGRP